MNTDIHVPQRMNFMTSDSVSLYSHEVHISDFGVKCLNILMLAMKSGAYIHVPRRINLIRFDGDKEENFTSEMKRY